MTCTLTVSADCGYSAKCSITGLVINTDQKLESGNIPTPTDVFLDDSNDASWTYILLNDDEERGKSNPDGVTVNYYDESELVDWHYASFNDLTDELIRVVESGKYLEKIWHDGEKTKIEYVYHLSTKVFK